MKNPGNDDFDVLVMSAPTVDISNLDTSSVSPSSNTDMFQQEAIMSSQRMFGLVTASLEQNPKLSKAVLMEHPPRFDKADIDPTALKQELVKLANATLTQLWLNSPLKDRISIGHHKLETLGVGATHMGRYENHRTGRYDGVHLYGKTGVRDYTCSVISILRSALVFRTAKFGTAQLGSAQFGSALFSSAQFGTAQFGTTQFGTSQFTDHTSCPQAKYQQKQFLPSVPLKNRFNLLNQKNC